MIANREEAQVFITVRMTQEEAKILKGLIQNPPEWVTEQQDLDFMNELFEELKEALNE